MLPDAHKAYMYLCVYLLIVKVQLCSFEIHGKLAMFLPQVLSSSGGQLLSPFVVAKASSWMLGPS